MDRERLFPDAHRDGLEERVAAFWNLDFVLPTPRVEISCLCGGVFVLKDWLLHERKGKPKPFRCDVRTKCVGCSEVRLYGVWLPEGAYLRAKTLFPRSAWISWREGREALSGEGFFDRGRDSSGVAGQ